MGMGAILVGLLLTWAVWESGWIVSLTITPIIAGVVMIAEGLGGLGRSGRSGRTRSPRVRREMTSTPPDAEDVVAARGRQSPVPSTALPPPPPDDDAPFPPLRDLAYAGHKLEDGDIARFERRRALRLPSQYKRFLLRFNGGELKPSWFAYQAGDAAGGAHVRRFFSLGTGGAEDIDGICAAYGGSGPGLPGRLLPVAAADPGLFLCLALAGPEAGAVFACATTVDEALPQATTAHRVSGDFFGLLSSLTWEPGAEPPPAPKRHRRRS